MTHYTSESSDAITDATAAYMAKRHAHRLSFEASRGEAWNDPAVRKAVAGAYDALVAPRRCLIETYGAEYLSALDALLGAVGALLAVCERTEVPIPRQLYGLCPGQEHQA